MSKGKDRQGSSTACSLVNVNSLLEMFLYKLDKYVVDYSNVLMT